MYWIMIALDRSFSHVCAFPGTFHEKYEKRNLYISVFIGAMCIESRYAGFARDMSSNSFFFNFVDIIIIVRTRYVNEIKRMWKVLHTSSSSSNSRSPPQSCRSAVDDSVEIYIS